MLALAAIGVLAGCQVEDDDPFDVRSSSSAVTMENGLEVNGMAGNGLYVNGLSFNSAVANGLYVNGLPFNGMPLNGLYVNGLYLNGIGTNGLPLNGLPLNGLYVNGLPLNGLPTNGLYLNGLYLNGLYLNGLYVNGLPVNGLNLNGLSINGLYLNGLPFNGLYVNGLYVNGLYVNGLPLNGVRLNGLYVNGATTSTAIRIANASGQLVNLTANQETSFESTIGHLAWCALPANDSLTIYRSTGAARSYPGFHGLAPSWKTSGLIDNPSGIDDSEELRWCVEHYRAVDSQNQVYPGLALNEQQLADLEVVLKYAISCALAPTDSVTVQFPSGAKTFAGGLSLATEWKTGPLSVAGQKAVSACLAARTNALGNTVRLSLRGPYPGLATSAVERANFKTHEGAFWGNVFGTTPELHACTVEGGGPSGRLCTDGSCGFQMTPAACSAACDTRDGDGNYTACGAADEAVVLNTFLMTENNLASSVVHSCARRADDSIWCWGDGGLGKLGNGVDDIVRTTAVATYGYPAPDKQSKQIATGNGHTCSRSRDGRLWCWGSNGFGRLGDGSGVNQYFPVQVTALGNAVANVDAGVDHSCAVKMDGTLWCWGWNDQGMLGDGTLTQRTTPVQVATIGNQVLEVGANQKSTCAIKMDGTLWCWGENGYGAVGDGTNTLRKTPVQVTALGNQVVRVTAHTQAHVCALKTDGTVWCWGLNSTGQLGNGSTTNRSTPGQVTALGNQVVEVEAGLEHTCALKTDGSVWCWGNNWGGSVGDGTTINRLTPVRVTLPRAVKTMVLGGSSSFALLTDGSVWAWGANSQGQLGDGTSGWNQDRLSPIRTTAMLRLGNGVCDFSESSTYEPAECPLSPPEAICTDGSDNDSDGAADCSDADCALDVNYRCGQLCGTVCDTGCPAALSCSGLSCGASNSCGLACGSSCDAGCGSCSNGIKDCGETGVDCGGSCSACAATPMTLFIDDFATGDTATLAPKWTEAPTGTAGKWHITGTVGGSAGYPYATTGATTAHAVACTATSGCSIQMATGVSLAGKTSATLTFWRFVHSSLDTGEYLKVEVYNGSSWTQVGNWTNGSGDDSTWRQESIALTPYLGRTNVKVRFTTKESATDEHVAIEDVKIVAQ